MTGGAIRAALVQVTSSDDPEANAARLLPLVAEAARGGAGLVCTPEMTNLMAPRERLRAVAAAEDRDPMLAALREAARRHAVYLAIGSLALREGEALVNRSLMIGPDGRVRGRYDKVHMFDVDLPGGESYRESATFRPGDRAVLARTGLGVLGLAICYDLRFPQLFRALAKGGAEVILCPAAFTRPTGEAHWEVLLRARAIETGSFVLAAAQTGTHAGGRETHGHSLAVAPWGEVLADGGREVGVTLVDLDLARVAEARGRVPALRHDRSFEGP
jgi:predicted amidohydrolase